MNHRDVFIEYKAKKKDDEEKEVTDLINFDYEPQNGLDKSVFRLELVDYAQHIL